jgi:hypothetical protein
MRLGMPLAFIGCVFPVFIQSVFERINRWWHHDGLIPEKSKAEVYLGSMESKHTTRFTRQKFAKK